MIDGNTVVVVTPFGRKGYLEILAPQILSDSDVDRWDLWMNAEHHADAAYADVLAGHPKVRIVTIPDPMTMPIAYRIFKFYKHATTTGEIYVRMDDDIVYYGEGDIGKLARYRLDNPRPFLVYGNVFNTGLTSYRHQKGGDIPESWGELTYQCMDPISWGEENFAVRLHSLFLKDSDPKKWHLPTCFLEDYERHSINVISWTGEDAQRWAHTVEYDEELWMSVQEPKRTGRPNTCVGDTFFSHFAFYTQRRAMDASGLLDKYRDLLTPWHRLGAATEAIRVVPAEKLLDIEWLSHMIGMAGLYDDGRPLYGKWSGYRAPLGHPGLWQHPEEFAAFLIYLSSSPPRRVLEVGTFYGFSAAIMSAYLRRFNPKCVVTTCDDKRWLPNPLPRVFDDIRYCPSLISDCFEGMDWDLVFIDGAHDKVSVTEDYINLQHAKLVALHDINDQHVDVPAVWQSLKSDRPHEEFIRDDGIRAFGIGLLK